MYMKGEIDMKDICSLINLAMNYQTNKNFKLSKTKKRINKKK